MLSFFSPNILKNHKKKIKTNTLKRRYLRWALIFLIAWNVTEIFAIKTLKKTLILLSRGRGIPSPYFVLLNIGKRAHLYLDTPSPLFSWRNVVFLFFWGDWGVFFPHPSVSRLSKDIWKILDPIFTSPQSTSRQARYTCYTTTICSSLVL